MFKIYNSNAISRTERFKNAIIFGVASAIVCLVISFILFKINFPNDLFYIGYGLLIGFAIQHFGKGVHIQFAVLAVGLYVLVIFITDLMWCSWDFTIFKFLFLDVYNIIIRVAGGYLAFRYSRIVG